MSPMINVALIQNHQLTDEENDTSKIPTNRFPLLRKKLRKKNDHNKWDGKIMISNYSSTCNPWKKKKSLDSGRNLTCIEFSERKYFNKDKVNDFQNNILERHLKNYRSR